MRGGGFIDTENQRIVLETEGQTLTAEALGGAGYVEESGMPRLYREAPLNSIWEGSGNVMCLDTLRAERFREITRIGNLAKVLRGGTEGEMLKMMKKDFATVRHVKPMASRDDSAELFVLATGFRGN